MISLGYICGCTASGHNVASFCPIHGDGILEEAVSLNQVEQRYIVICDHVKKIVTAFSEHDARFLLHCEKCSTVSRAYLATEDDLRLLAIEQRVTKRTRYKSNDQLGWVDPTEDK